MMWNLSSSRCGLSILICFLIAVCSRQNGAAAILFLTSTMLSENIHFAVSNAENWNTFNGCVCGRGKLCSVDFDYVRYDFTSYQYKNIISLNTPTPGGNGRTTITNGTSFVCKIKYQKSWCLECNLNEGYADNSVNCSAAACPYYLGISCADNLTVLVAWDCSQHARVVMYSSDHVNLIPTCPGTTQTKVPTTTSTSSSSSSITTITTKLSNQTTTTTMERNTSGLDDKNDEMYVIFTGVHIGVIVAVSLVSVVVTLIIVVVIWKLRKKDGKVPPASHTGVSSNTQGDNEENVEYVKANPVYGYTFSSTDTDVQPYSIQTVDQHRSGTGNYTNIELPQLKGSAGVKANS